MAKIVHNHLSMGYVLRGSSPQSEIREVPANTLRTLTFPDELGLCRGTPLAFFDTNVLIDAKDFVKDLFLPPPSPDDDQPVSGVICDFIEGEARNLKKGLDILDNLKTSANSQGFYFRTKYNSYEGARKALDDFPNPEMAESVLVEFDKKLELSERDSATTSLKRGSDSKSRFGDFSLLTVAAVCAARRKRQSIVVTRDRWIKLSCKRLREHYKLPLYCEDQWSFSVQDIVSQAKRAR